MGKQLSNLKELNKWGENQDALMMKRDCFFPTKTLDVDFNVLFVSLITKVNPHHPLMIQKIHPTQGPKVFGVL